jgi:selenocysteine-specific elongation factor
LGEGTIAVGDDVQLVPSGRTVRVRGIQSHRSKRERLEPVARAAINLTGVVRSEVSRGDALVTGGPWRMAREILASVRPARYVERIKARGAFTLHLGTAHTRARIRFFDARDGQEMTELSAGIEAVAVIRLSDPLPVLPLDRFILRDTGARRVVAGGVILEIDPDRSQPSSRLDPTAGTRADVARGLCERRGPMPITTLLESCGIDEPPADLVAVGSWIMTAADFERLHAELAGTVSRFHAENPVAAGIKRVELVDILGWEPSLADAMISDQRTSVATDGVLVREASFQIQLPDGAQEIVRRFEVAGLKPPDAAEAGVSGDLIEALVRAGRLQRIGDLLFAETAVHHAEELVRATLSRGPATTSELRAVLGTSRKFAIPLLEHLDRRRVTRFDGERRSLVE